MTREEFLDILELGLKEQSYCLCNKMLIRDKLLEIIDLLENENTYFFGLRLLEDFENKDSLKKYNIFIDSHVFNIELSIFRNFWKIFIIYRDEVRVFKNVNLELHKVKNLTELKNEIN